MNLQLDQTGKFTRSLLRYYFLTGAFEGVVAFTILLFIPKDPKNIWRFGYSKSRLILFACLALFISVFLWLTIRSFLDADWLLSFGRRIKIQITEYGWFFPIALVLFGILVLGPYIYLLIEYPRDGAILRIMPVILLATIRTLQTILALCAIKLKTQKRLVLTA